MADRVLYLVVSGGRPVHWTDSKEDALLEAKSSFEEHVTHFWRHKLPLKMTEDIVREIDLFVAEVSESSSMEIPWQKWHDDSYAERQIYAQEDKDSEEAEYQRYLKLHEKWNRRREDEVRKSPLFGELGPKDH